MSTPRTVEKIPSIVRKGAFSQDAALAIENGWTITQTKGGHLLWCSPEGAKVTSPSTPSDKRGVLNTRSQLRREGLPIPHRAKGGSAKGKRRKSR